MLTVVLVIKIFNLYYKFNLYLRLLNLIVILCIKSFTMKPNKNKKLILSLIKDDLINYHLITGLEALGFDASHYTLFLSETIFDLIGINGGDDIEQEALYKLYLGLFKKVRKFDLTENNEQLEDLALEVYMALVARYKTVVH